MNIEELIKIIVTLKERTKEKKANWQKAPVQGGFQIVLENGALMIRRGDFVSASNLAVFNKDGVQVNSFFYESDSPIGSEINDLWDEVDESVSKRKETIKGISMEILSGKEIGRLEDDLPF